MPPDDTNTVVIDYQADFADMEIRTAAREALRASIAARARHPMEIMNEVLRQYMYTAYSPLVPAPALGQTRELTESSISEMLNLRASTPNEPEAVTPAMPRPAVDPIPAPRRIRALRPPYTRHPDCKAFSNE